MELLKERIRKDGVMKPGNVLKVDSFLNHQMDIELFNEMGKEFKRRFEGVKIDKILTIEASGIGIAAIVAQYFKCPVVFAKKSQSINLDGTMLSAPVESFTHKRKYEVIVASKFLHPDENVLVIDDFIFVLSSLLRKASSQSNGSSLQKRVNTYSGTNNHSTPPPSPQSEY